MADDRFEQTTFGELIAEGALEIGDGYRAKNVELGGDGLIFLRAGHVSDTHIDFDGAERFHAELEPRVRSKLAKAGDAVITTKGNSTGRTTFVSPWMPPFVYSPHLSYWRSLDPNRIEGGFLRYWCKGREFTTQLAGMKGSTDMAPYLSLVDQKRLEITLPPIGEQRAIAHVLGTLDDKIELNRRMNETLEATARALFRSWFVDFDPVHAKAEGRDPGLPKPIADLFPDRLVDSEMGEIPEGWDMGAVGDLAALSRDGLKPGEFSGEVFDHYSIPAYDDGRTPKAELGEAIKSNKLLVLPDCVLLSKLNPRIPRVWLPVLHESRRSICSTEFLVVIPKSGVSRELLYGMFSSNAFMNEFATLVTGTSGSHQRVKPEALLNLVVARPPPSLVRHFTRLVCGYLDRVAHNRAECCALAALRDTLLPKLIPGDVRPKHVEEVLV